MYFKLFLSLTVFEFDEFIILEFWSASFIAVSSIVQSVLTGTGTCKASTVPSPTHWESQV